MVFVAEVGVVICQVVPQAGARGGGVTAAERNAIQQVTAVHVTPDSTGDRGGSDIEKIMETDWKSKRRGNFKA